MLCAEDAATTKTYADMQERPSVGGQRTLLLMVPCAKGLRIWLSEDADHQVHMLPQPQHICSGTIIRGQTQ
jgi:hypothetical protein